MPPVKMFPAPPNRLAAALAEPGGVPVAEALRRARDNLAEVREEGMASIDAAIAALEEVCAQARLTFSQAQISCLYDIANALINEAGAFGLMELSQASRSLCELLGQPDALGSREAVCIHIEAMKSLRSLEADADAGLREALLEGLAKIAQRKTSKPR